MHNTELSAAFGAFFLAVYFYRSGTVKQCVPEPGAFIYHRYVFLQAHLVQQNIFWYFWYINVAPAGISHMHSAVDARGFVPGKGHSVLFSAGYVKCSGLFPERR